MSVSLMHSFMTMAFQLSSKTMLYFTVVFVSGSARSPCFYVVESAEKRHRTSSMSCSSKLKEKKTRSAYTSLPFSPFMFR